MRMSMSNLMMAVLALTVLVMGVLFFLILVFGLGLIVFTREKKEGTEIPAIAPREQREIENRKAGA
jgi:hypothetical protein